MKNFKNVKSPKILARDVQWDDLDLEQYEINNNRIAPFILKCLFNY